MLSLGVLRSVGEQPPLTAFLVLLVALFNLGVHGAGRWFLPGALATGAILGALQLASAVAGQSVGDVVPSVLFLGGAFVVGRALGSSRRQALAERSRAADVERARDQRVDDAVAAERARIARELHDVIAHALTGIVVQAGVEARLQSDPHDRSHTTLRMIEQRGREAMVELRRLLGLLREDGQGPASGPLPSLVAVDTLLDDLRRAGHEVAAERCGDLGGLPPAVDLAGYRVVQEALTNVARHAPGSPVSIALSRRTGALSIQVRNGPPTVEAVPLTSGGNGLVGMRERVRVYGGSVATAALPDGGYRVDVELPLPDASGGAT